MEMQRAWGKVTYAMSTRNPPDHCPMGAAEQAVAGLSSLSLQCLQVRQAALPHRRSGAQRTAVLDIRALQHLNVHRAGSVDRFQQ